MVINHLNIFDSLFKDFPQFLPTVKEQKNMKRTMKEKGTDNNLKSQNNFIKTYSALYKYFCIYYVIFYK